VARSGSGRLRCALASVAAINSIRRAGAFRQIVIGCCKPLIGADCALRGLAMIYIAKLDTLHHFQFYDNSSRMSDESFQTLTVIRYTNLLG
jgi:hypothetical protein